MPNAAISRPPVTDSPYRTRTVRERPRPYRSPGEDGGFLEIVAHVPLPRNGRNAGRVLPLLAAARRYRPVLRADHRPGRRCQLPQPVKQIADHVAAQRIVVVATRLACTDQARILQNLGV